MNLRGFLALGAPIRSILAAVLLTAFNTPQVASLPQAAEAPSGPSLANPDDDALWDLTPIVTRGMPVAGDPPRKIESVGRIYPIDRDTMLLQVVLDGENKLSVEALVEYKNGKLTVLAAGPEYSLKQVTYRMDVGIRLNGVMTTPSGITISNAAALGNKVFLTGQEAEARGKPIAVYSWDAKGLVRVLGRGDVIQFSGKTFAIKNAQLHLENRFQRTSSKIVHFETDSGADGIAVLDARGIRPVLIESESVPGRQDTTLKLVFDDTLNETDEVVAWALLIGNDKKKVKGLFAFSDSSTSEIAVLGDPLPEEGAKKTVYSSTLVAAGPSNMYLVLLNSEYYIGRRGSWKKIVTDGFGEGVAYLLGNPSIVGSTSEICFLPGKTSSFVFRSLEEHSSSVLIAGGYYDGERLRSLSWRNAIPTFVPTAPGGRHVGAILEYSFRTSDSVEADSYRREVLFLDSNIKPVPDVSTFELVVAATGELRIPSSLPLSPEPFFRTSDRRVGLSDAVAWFSENDGVVRMNYSGGLIYTGGARGESDLWRERISNQFIRFGFYNMHNEVHRMTRSGAAAP